MDSLRGIAVSPGVSIGKAWVLAEAAGKVTFRTVDPSQVPGERARVEKAIAESLQDLADLRSRTNERDPEAAKIFDFHIGLLSDSKLVAPILDDITRESVTAEYAVSEALQKLADTFRAMGSETFQQKANDVVDLERRVVGKLAGDAVDLKRMAGASAEATIIVAHELTPSDASQFHHAGALGFVTDGGGLTGHTSIIARALGIPTVVGCGTATIAIKDGDEVIVDGSSGTVIVRPDTATLDRYEADRDRIREHRSSLRETAQLESVTLDGVRVKLLGNIEFPEEVSTTLDNGGDGVGLYRTEFLHLTSHSAPTEEDHFQAYRRTLDLLQGRILTLRTLDLGADKHTQEHLAEQERNPFLGLRSIRFCLRHPALFKTQLRAVLRASAFGPLRMMFPLVCNLMELRRTKMIVRDLCEELAEEGIPFDPAIQMGVMIEVPSAAIMARSFANESDFLSIGTNDLTQYTLAVDRGNERVASLYTAADPAVISLVKTVVRAGRHTSKEVSVCGEVAGDPRFTMLLLGLGVRTLSMTPAQIPVVKRVLRSVDIPQCELLARRVGSFESERQVATLLRDELRRIDPEALVGSSD